MTSPKFDESITVGRAFDAMRRFLEGYWERGGKKSDDLAVLLGSLNRDEGSRSLPLDPALWSDWLDAIEEARKLR
jgi:hypothetical protein